MEYETKFRYSFYIEIIGLMLATCMVIFLGPDQFIYDERYYLSDIPLLKKYGIGKAYLQSLHGPAGPTHPVLHYLLLPLTGLKVIAVRMVNILLFMGSVLFLNRIFKQFHQKPIGMIGICIPMSMAAIGMALTEMPAIFFLCLGIYFFLQRPADKRYLVIAKLLSGIFISFAVLGRQPLLLIIPFFIYLNGLNKEKIIENLVFLVAGLTLPLYCFFIWGGLIPSKWNILAEGSYTINHFVISLGYTLLCFLVIAPAFLRLPFKIKSYIILLCMPVFFVVAFLAELKFPMLNTLAAKVLPSGILEYYPYLCFAILMIAAIYMVIVFGYHLFENRSNKLVVFSVISCGAILISTLAIRHQFSSRYVFQAFPFFLILAEPYVKFTRVSNIIRAIGIFIGLGSLFTYFS